MTGVPMFGMDVPGFRIEVPAFRTDVPSFCVKVPAPELRRKPHFKAAMPWPALWVSDFEN